MVETIDASQRQEALIVLNYAFADSPMLPAGTPPETREALLNHIIDSFIGSGKAWLHGIRADDTLACVAFSYDTRIDPKGLALLRFFFGLFSNLGWCVTRDLIRGMSKRPKHGDPHLELMLLGTLPRFQKQGMGKAMLHFLYEFAKDMGYYGVTLETAIGTPAYDLYIKEGFVSTAQFVMNDIPMCNMRRGNTE
jgi:GNAT superfamily N-acetyltransferase